MPPILTPTQTAFDAAVKARADFLYRGIADLEDLRASGSELGPLVDQLIQIRDGFNAALAIEGQNIVGDAPHAPFYLDYIDADTSNGLAFRDANHSFIGITIPRIIDVATIAKQIAEDDAVISAIGFPPPGDRESLRAVLLWMLLGFVVAHEYAHHTHGHFGQVDDPLVVGRLRRQAREVDADGWAAYLMLNHWVLADGRPALLKLLRLEDGSTAVQDAVASSCFVAAQATFTFVRQPQPTDKDKVYWDTHPLQSVRLELMSRHVLKFAREFRPTLHETLTQPWYQSLMDAVSRLMWKNEKHAALWREHADFLRTPDGVAYANALVAELDDFRATLRQWEAEARACRSGD